MTGVGVIGVGLMGRRHAENVARTPDAKLVAVYDAVPATREGVARELETAACASVEDLLARDDVQAVVVASPAAWHEPHALAALAAGKDVLVEKPIAASLDGADRVVAAAQRSKLRLQVGFQRRYDAAYAEARRIVASGELGRALFYRGINRDRDAPAGPPGSLAPANILVESAIHDLDGGRWMLGAEPVAARATLATLGAAAPGPDLALVWLRFASGAVAEIETFRGARYAYDIRSEIVCEEGAIVVGGFAQTMLTVLRANECREDLYPGFLERYADAYRAEVRDFVAGVADRRPVRVTAEDGRRALALALAGARAAEIGGEVAV
ncbi:MAG TPA: Gfo/Idh/MocA family oxidoreductase [Candidatus Limnocylindria bacterium]|nr:Gfo/Idh/MocA family oxidoreductase [Candidatus Limnocylindria bacterium]